MALALVRFTNLSPDQSAKLSFERPRTPQEAREFVARMNQAEAEKRKRKEADQRAGSAALKRKVSEALGNAEPAKPTSRLNPSAIRAEYARAAQVASAPGDPAERPHTLHELAAARSGASAASGTLIGDTLIPTSPRGGRR